MDAYVKLQDPVGQFPAEFARMADAMAHGMNPAAKDLETTTEGLGLSLGEVIGLAGDMAKELTKAKFDKSAKDLEKWADATAQAVEGLDAYDTAMKGMDWGQSDLDGAVTAMSKFTEAHFALKDIQADTEKAFDSLTESVKANGKSFDVTTDKGRANQAALEDVAHALDTKLAAAYADADGDQEKFKENAGKLAAETLTRLQKELGLSKSQTDDMAKALGLLPEDLETRYKLSGDEEAKAKIGLLQGAIDALPKDVQAKVTQQIILGDYQAPSPRSRATTTGTRRSWTPTSRTRRTGRCPTSGGYIASYYRSHKWCRSPRWCTRAYSMRVGPSCVAAGSAGNAAPRSSAPGTGGPRSCPVRRTCRRAPGSPVPAGPGRSWRAAGHRARSRSTREGPPPRRSRSPSRRRRR